MTAEMHMINGVLFTLILLTVAKRNHSSLQIAISELSEIHTAIGNAMQIIIQRHFYDFPCIGFITENNSYILEFMPKNVLFVNIQLGSDKLSCIEEKDTYVSEGLNENTLFFENLITMSMDYRCLGYVIEVSNYKSLIFSFSRATRKTLQRFNSRILFIPKVDNDYLIRCKENYKGQVTGFLEDILMLNQMNMFPDIVAMEIETTYNESCATYTDEEMSEFQTYNGTDFDSYNASMEIVENGKPGTVKRGFHALKLVTNKFVGESPSDKVILKVWNAQEKELKFDNLFPNKLLNLQGKQLVVASLEYKPYTILNLNTTSYDGVELRIINELSDILNFTWKAIVDEVNQWGSVFPNGSGNGIVGFICEEKANFGVAAFYGTWHFVWMWVDFTSSYMRAAMTGVMPAPKLQPRWRTLIWPFSKGIWLAVGVTFLVSTAGTYVVAKISHKYLKENGTVGPYRNLINCAFQIFGLLVLQVYEGNDEERYLILRILTTFLDVIIFTLSSIYTGGLASVLTIPRYNHPIDTLSDLAESNLLWAAQDEAFVWSLYDSHDPIVEKIVDNFRVWNEEELAREALKAESGFVMEAIYGGICSRSSHLNDETMSKLRIMYEPLYWAHVITLTQKSSPYTPYFNKLVYQLREAGIILYWEGEVARLYNSGCGTGPEYDSGPTNLTINHVQGAFILLDIGLILSSLTFTWEVMGSKAFDKFKAKKRKTVRKLLGMKKRFVTNIKT